MNTFPLEPDRLLQMPATFEKGFMIFALIGLLYYTAIGVKNLVKHKDPLLLFLLLGGFMGEMLEPICNVLGMAYHPENGQIVGFNTLGRDIPLWLMMTYPWYFAAFAYQLIDWDRKGVLTKDKYWKAFGAAALFAFVIEIWPVQVVFWDYFGPQPLTFFGMPLLWYVVNPTSIIAAGAFSLLAIRGKTGMAAWPVLVIMPVSIVGFHTGVFAPAYMTQNAGWTANESIFTAVITCIFAVVLLKTFVKLIFHTRPSED